MIYGNDNFTFQPAKFYPFKDLDEIKANVAVERTFTPALDESERLGRLGQWHRAVERSLKWEEA